MLEFDFGKGFIVSEPKVLFRRRYESICNEKQARERRQVFASGTLQNDSECKYHGCHVYVYADGQYDRVVRLLKSIPTFDSGDREYDSWHELILSRRKDGHMEALYSAGGYRLARMELYEEVSEIPEALKTYFEANNT